MSQQPCTKPFKRHLYRGAIACERCGCPNPSWIPNGVRYAKILVLFRPARRPAWWPKGDDGRAAWATLNFDNRGVWGYTLGRHRDLAGSPRLMWAAIDCWEEDNDNRLWDFKIEQPGKTSKDTPV